MNAEAMRTVFDCFDLDKSGGIDLQELQSAVQVMGISITAAQVAKVFREADADNSGEIDFDEFTSILRRSDGGAIARLIHKMVRTHQSEIRYAR